MLSENQIYRKKENIEEIITDNPLVINFISDAVCDAIREYSNTVVKPMLYNNIDNIKDENSVIMGVTKVKYKKKFQHLAISFSKSVFLLMYENIFNEKQSDISEENKDLASEILNIIFQIIDSDFNKLGYILEPNIPKVLFDIELKEWLKTHKNRLIIPFTSPKGEFQLKIYQKFI